MLWLTKGLGPGGAERLLVEMARTLDRGRATVTAGYVLPWKDHLAGELEAAGVPAGAVQDARDVTRHDPQLAHRGHWVRLPHAEMGESIYNNLPFRFSRLSVQPSRPAPLLGEHTHEVLRDVLGLSDAEIGVLQEQQVLR